MTENKLKETKGVFKLIGKVTRIDKDGAFKEEVMNKPNNKNDGRVFRSIRFGVKTSDENEITVGSFDYEPEEVFMWNSEKRKEDENYKGDRIPFGTWEEQEESLREQGYAVLQSRIGVEYGDDGKLKTRGLPRYVASKEIYDNINNGDSVVIEGTIRYSRYENRNGETVEQKNYTIEKLFKIKDVDFEAEDFEEVTYFEQKMVYIDTDIDKKEGRAFVTGRVVDFMGNYEDTQFIIDMNGEEEGEYDDDMVKMAKAFKSKMKFGDVVNVFGDTLNKVVINEDEADEEMSEEDELLASLGGRKKPKHAQRFVSRSYITEMRIQGIDEWTKEVYSEDDFEKDSLVEDDDDGLSDFGGKKKSKNANPFDDDEVDLDDPDLPF